jgi:hypothetical protein
VHDTAKTIPMEHKEPANPFARSAYDKAEEAIEHAREVREQKIAALGKHRVVAEARLIADGGLQRCSVCDYSFPVDVHPSMSVAFAEHLLKAHQPGQTTKAVNDAAADAVEETTSEEKDAD